MIKPLKVLPAILLSIGITFGASAQPVIARSPGRARLAAEQSRKPQYLVEFEGKVADASGNPLDGSYLLRFELYDSPDGGVLRWEESLYVAVASGRFRAQLGRLKPLPRDVFSKGYRLTVTPPEGTGWVAAGVKPPQTIAAKPAPAPAPEASPEPPAAPKEKIVERAAPAQLEVEIPEPAQAPRGSGSSIYEVRPGETLRSIAVKLYGNPDRWVDLYQANDDRILRGGDLVPGQKLIVPGDGGSSLK